MSRHAQETAMLGPLHHHYVTIRQELGVENTTNKKDKNWYFPEGVDPLVKEK